MVFEQLKHLSVAFCMCWLKKDKLWTRFSDLTNTLYLFQSLQKYSNNKTFETLKEINSTLQVYFNAKLNNLYKSKIILGKV